MFIFLFKYEGGTKVCVYRRFKDLPLIYRHIVYLDTYRRFGGSQ